LDKAIAAIQLVLVARLLTPSDFGVMAASAAIVLAFVTISELGLESSLVSKPQVEQEDLAVVWTLAMGRGAAMALCLWASADLIGQAMHMAQLPEVLRVHAWALVLQGLHSPGMALLLKNLDFKRRVTMDLISRVIEAGVTILLAFWFRNVWALLAGQLVGLCVRSLLSFRVVPFKPRLSFHRPSLNYVLRYGTHLNVTALCIFGVMSGGELVIGRVLGQEALGLYQIALAIPLLIGVRATALIHQLSMPTYALLQNDQSGLVRVFELQMGLAGLVFIPPAVGVAVLAPVIVPIAFGTQWLSIIDPLRILCLYAVCAGLSSVMTALHHGVNRVDLQMKSWMAQFLVYAAVIVPLIGYAGIAGAAAALSACYVVGLSLQWIGTRPLIGKTVDEIVWSIGRAVAVAVLFTGSLVLVIEAGIVPMMSWLVLAVCMGVFGWYCWHVWFVEVPRLKVLWEHH
jgi:PST family polysaccharide transporter/lipopolysaccharide exporter